VDDAMNGEEDEEDDFSDENFLNENDDDDNDNVDLNVQPAQQGRGAGKKSAKRVPVTDGNSHRAKKAKVQRA
jgi:hypothetical protein